MLVTVYITTKNRVVLLKRAVNSVINQTYKNLELIVVDDGSTDATVQYLEKIQSERIRFLRNEKSLGACACRNMAIKAARGDWVTGLDDDDYFAATRIEIFLEASKQLDAREYSFFYSDFVVKSARGFELRELPLEATLDKLKKSNCVGCQIFIKRELILQGGGYTEDMPAWQDYETWFRLVKQFGRAVKVKNSPSYIVDIAHSGSRISTGVTGRYKLALEKFLYLHQESFGDADKKYLEANYWMYEQVDFKLEQVFRTKSYGGELFFYYLKLYLQKKISNSKSEAKYIIRRLIDNPRGALMISAYRIAHFASVNKKRFFPLNALWAYPTLVLYRGLTELLMGYEIPAATKIGEYLYIHHGYGIVINKHAVLGRCVEIRHNVTIGCKTQADGTQGKSPVIGNFVEIGAGAAIIGDIHIGDYSKIGANSIITRSVEAGETVVSSNVRVSA